MREKISRWMYGRYGMDNLSKTLVYVSLTLWVITLFFNNVVTDVIAIVFLLYAYFRILSKNTSKRYAELVKFEAAVTKIKRFPQNMAMRRQYHIYKCPQCGQKMRVPRGKGRLEISCPRCAAKFIKKS